MPVRIDAHHLHVNPVFVHPRQAFFYAAQIEHVSRGSFHGILPLMSFNQVPCFSDVNVAVNIYGSDAAAAHDDLTSLQRGIGLQGSERGTVKSAIGEEDTGS